MHRMHTSMNKTPNQLWFTGLANAENMVRPSSTEAGQSLQSQLNTRLAEMGVNADASDVAKSSRNVPPPAAFRLTVEQQAQLMAVLESVPNFNVKYELCVQTLLEYERSINTD